MEEEADYTSLIVYQNTVGGSNELHFGQTAKPVVFYTVNGQLVPRYERLNKKPIQLKGLEPGTFMVTLTGEFGYLYFSRIVVP